MSLEGRTIALVEDDPIMGESLLERLSLEGVRVLWWQSCSVVVCDLRLPDGTGEEVFKIASGQRADPHRDRQRRQTCLRRSDEPWYWSPRSGACS
jgi:hypothetical protein